MNGLSRWCLEWRPPCPWDHHAPTVDQRPVPQCVEFCLTREWLSGWEEFFVQRDTQNVISARSLSRHVKNVTSIGVARSLSAEVHFYHPAKTPKNWLLLWLGVHLVSCGGALTHFSCKLGLKNFFFTALGGAGAPTAPPGYAYGNIQLENDAQRHHITTTSNSSSRIFWAMTSAMWVVYVQC